MGFSGASIVFASNDRVIKRGPGCREQAEYALELGIGPPIYQLMRYGYSMQKMCSDNVSDATRADPLKTLMKVADLLATSVWCHSMYPADDSRAWTNDSTVWKDAFASWESEQELPLMGMFNHFYGTSLIQQTRIHGDPTLSNVLWDREGRLYIADPIRPAGKIPGTLTVDIGKMMQSVAGWEHVMFGFPILSDEDVYKFCQKYEANLLRRGIFWLMVHALRIIPYAKANRHPLAESWSWKAANIIHRDIRGDVSPCSTLMTLTELSRTLAKRS